VDHVNYVDDDVDDVERAPPPAAFDLVLDFDLDR
jgi:hypothetical protein